MSQNINDVEQEYKDEGQILKPSTTDHPLYSKIVEACKTVYDPEIPVNIYDLGLIYTVEIRIKMMQNSNVVDSSRLSCCW